MIRSDKILGGAHDSPSDHRRKSGPKKFQAPDLISRRSPHAHQRCTVDTQPRSRVAPFLFVSGSRFDDAAAAILPVFPDANTFSRRAGSAVSDVFRRGGHSAGFEVGAGASPFSWSTR